MLIKVAKPFPKALQKTSLCFSLALTGSSAYFLSQSLIPRDEVSNLVGASQDSPPGDRDRKFPNLTESSKALTEVEFC